VGLFLSSGLDSTAIAAIAARAQAGICSFTLSFPERLSTKPREREACETLRTRIRYTAGGEAVLSRIDEAVAALDQPSMDGINTYLCRGSTRSWLKGALSGVGGDELFGGYATFTDTPRITRLIQMAWFVPAPMRKALRRCCEQLIAARSSRTLRERR